MLPPLRRLAVWPNPDAAIWTAGHFKLVGDSNLFHVASRKYPGASIQLVPAIEEREWCAP